MNAKFGTYYQQNEFSNMPHQQFQMRDISPVNHVQTITSPININFNDESAYSLNQNQTNTININTRKNILDQINSQYEENYRVYQNERRENTSKERVNNFTSPLNNHNNRNMQSSLSPSNIKVRKENIDETIQGAIDGGMTAVQIQNKKAFVWAFGKNQEGELALGVYKDALLPRFVSGFKGVVAKYIASSNHHSAMISQEGQIHVCGSSLHGKLGIEGLDKTNINKFQIVPSLQRKKAKQLACGDYHTLCLLEDGTVYQFGGSLFKKDKISRSQERNSQQILVPKPIQQLYGKDIVQIDCGDFHSAALDANGDLYTWGGGAASYNKGQCGHGHTNFIEFPEKIKYLASKRIVKISCGGFHTLALSSDNELFAFGSGCYGECGYGEFYDTTKPKSVKFPDDYLASNVNVTDDLEEYGNDEERVLSMYLKEQAIITNIVAGGRHSLVLTKKGKVFSFGYGTNGQLGLRNTHNYAKPMLVKDLDGKNVVQIAAGQYHSMILTDKGDVYTCGYGAHGQLGHGDKESKTSFTYVSNLGNKNIKKIFAGGNHSWIILDQVVPLRDKWSQPSPLKQGSNFDNTKAFNSATTPMKANNDIYNQQSKNSTSKNMSNMMNGSFVSPYQKSLTKNDKSNMSQATFGGRTQNSNIKYPHNQNENYNNLQQDIDSRNYNYSHQQTINSSQDEFVQRIIEIQQQQLLKAQYYVQVTYCETEFCHRFVNFEVHGQFVKQFEQMLEDYIQQSYQQEKGLLYHKLQELPQDIINRVQNPMTPGERLLKEAQKEKFQDLNSEYDDLDDSFSNGDEKMQQHKDYSLCLICNPVACSYDDIFKEWKKEQLFNHGKAKKIVINSSSFQHNATGIGGGSGQYKHQQQQQIFKAVNAGNDENQAPLIGKIVFLKDSDIENNNFEEQMSKWVSNFNRKLAKYCIKKPRYSELRPMKYSLS